MPENNPGAAARSDDTSITEPQQRRNVGERSDHDLGGAAIEVGRLELPGPYEHARETGVLGTDDVVHDVVADHRRSVG